MVHRRLGEETVLVHLGSGEMFSLNATGSFLFECLDDGLTYGTTLERARAEFAVEPRRLAGEAADLVRALLAQDLLVRAAAGQEGATGGTEGWR